MKALIGFALSLIWFAGCGHGACRETGTTAPGGLGSTQPRWNGLPVYDHIVIVVEENKNYEDLIDASGAPFVNRLRREGANFTQMFGEEHFSQGNYFWLFSGSNHNIGFVDVPPPPQSLVASNLGGQLLRRGYSFKGYSESLPAIGDVCDAAGVSPKYPKDPLYARKHVPWISFRDIPAGATVETSSNLRFEDFPKPTAYDQLPTVAFVIPNLDNDMHNGPTSESVPTGDAWLKEHLESYYEWAKTHNSLLVLTFDENDDKRAYQGLTNAVINPDDSPTGDAGARSKTPCGGDRKDPALKELCVDLQNRIVTIFAGAHIKPGDYPEGKGITHINILRMLEAMYDLPKSGAQQPNAAGGRIADESVIRDVFE